LREVKTLQNPVANTDSLFSKYIPKIYEAYIVPLLFQPYAEDLANRVAERKPKRLLEIAAGTGVVTRVLAFRLAATEIVATDLNQPMIDHAVSLGTARPVEWRQADAMDLPFDDESFDAVVCQFGVMFFPDRAKAYAETRRVLGPGGVFIFNTWDRIEENDIAATVTVALTTVFPADPPRFMARIPHGYHDRAAIERDLADAGFAKKPEIVTVTKRSRAKTARDAAIAICQGTPVRNEIEARAATRLEEATDVATEEIAKRFGRGPIDAKMQAHVVTIAAGK
jgi:ubiquinone/menaquinone biosynthesis C-methylase UbiE